MCVCVCVVKNETEKTKIFNIKFKNDVKIMHNKWCIFLIFIESYPFKNIDTNVLQILEY